MVTEITDKTTIDNILDVYSDYLDNLTDPRTGSPLNLTSRAARVHAINIGLYQPEILLVWGQDMSFSQLDIYLPWIKRSRYKIGIICKSLKGKKLSSLNLDNTPVYTHLNKTSPNGSLGASGSLRGMLYISEKTANFTYVKSWPHVTHVFPNHGDSDKHSSSSRTTMIYDFAFVADRRSMSRFMNSGMDMSPERFLLVGGAVVDGVDAVGSGFAESKKFLYAPTWEGHADVVNFSSIGKIDESIEEAITHAAFRFRPHPGLGARLTDIAKSRNIVKGLMEPRRSKADDFNWADALIADNSGIISEFLFTRKPIIVPLSNDWVGDYLRSTDLRDFVYLWDYVSTPFEEMKELVARDPLRDSRVQRANQLFDGIESVDDSARLFDRALDYIGLHTEFKQRRAGVRRPLGVHSAPTLRIPRRISKAVSAVSSGAAVLGI